MPLDKIKDVEEYAETHKSSVLHIKNNPVACILEKNSKNILKFQSIENSIFSCKILTDQFVKTKSEFDKFKKISND